MIALVRIVGYIEAISYMALFFFAMPMKYFAGDPQYVKVIGMVHGILWSLYMLSIFLAYNLEKIDFKLGRKLVVFSLIPIGPFLCDRQLREKQAA